LTFNYIYSYYSGISNLDLEILKLGNFGGNTYLSSSTMKIGPLVTIKQDFSFNLGGDGTIIMDGTWTSSLSFTSSVNMLGTGTWIFSGSYLSIGGPADFTGLLNVTNSFIQITGYGNHTFTRILMVGTSSLDASCDRLVVTDLTVPIFSDRTYGSTNITNAQIPNYVSSNGGVKYIKTGIFETIIAGQGSYRLILDQIQVRTLTAQLGSTVVAQTNTVITNFEFYGGTIWQLDGSGLFKVTNTTYLGTSFPKGFQSTTVLRTTYLDCNDCTSPDCAIPLTEWSHIQYTTTSFGCII